MQSASLPRHTPYDGSDPLFKIGLQPLDLEDWIEVDDRLGEYLAEKDRLEAIYGDRVFVEEPDTKDAQQEVLDLLSEHLGTFHSRTHLIDEAIAKVAGREIDLHDAQSPLKIASRLVQEDLIIMRKGSSGWRLVAASLSFPSSWSLREKFSLPLHDIHAPVPGFGSGTRNAMLIERIFDKLLVDQPVRRFNWSIYSDDALFHDDRSAEHLKKGELAAGAFLRIEHQTLRKLQRSGDILFTVRIHVDPFDVLVHHPRKIEICEGFIGSLQAMKPEELDYKGLTNEVGSLIKRLQQLVRKTGQ